MVVPAMTKTLVDASTGNLLVAGKPVFPLGLSDPPPLGSTAPNGVDAWAEIASAGVNFLRNYTVWTAAGVEEQMLPVAQELAAAPRHGLQLWLGLAGVDNDLTHASLLGHIVGTFEGHPGLGAWKAPTSRRTGALPPRDASRSTSTSRRSTRITRS
jgi:hypothetical protein